MARLGRSQPFPPKIGPRLAAASTGSGAGTASFAVAALAVGLSFAAATGTASAAFAASGVGVSTAPSGDVLLIGAEVGILDESSYARTLTAAGNAARTTAQAKFGSASLTFDGTGDWIQAANSAEFAFGAGDFTVEAWVRFTKVGADLFGQWDNTGVVALCSWFLWVSGGNITFRGCFASGFTDVTGAFTPTLNQWYHIAADRTGTTLRVYVDGVVKGTNASFPALNNSASAVTLGAIGTSNPFPTSNFGGQLDEVRFTKGIARYAGAFTPPTAPFPRPGGGSVASASFAFDATAVNGSTAALVGTGSFAFAASSAASALAGAAGSASYVFGATGRSPVVSLSTIGITLTIVREVDRTLTVVRAVDRVLTI